MSDRLTALREAVEKILPAVEGVIALKSGPSGNIAPHLFQKERPEELAALAVWPKMPLPSVLRLIQKAHPEAKLAVVCRGCEERGIVEMSRSSACSASRTRPPSAAAPNRTPSTPRSQWASASRACPIR
jgi:coenzyme F420-reducing hydrogenase beta subunit